MQERETCAGCRFYDPDLDLRREVSPLLGFCRRHPPAPAALKARDTFPKVRCNDWCGDFEASGQKPADGGAATKHEAWEWLTQCLLNNVDEVEGCQVTWPHWVNGIPQPGCVTIQLKAPK